MGGRVTACCIVFLVCQHLIGQHNYLDISKRVINYLEDTRVEKNDMTVWPVMPEVSPDEDISLYSGTPGIVLLYLEMFYATGDSLYMKRAEQGSLFLVHSLTDSTPGPEKLGFYTGAAGIAYTLKEVSKISSNPKIKDGYRLWLRRIEKHLDSVEDDSRFGDYTEIVYGAAGIGLAMIDQLEFSNESWILEIMISCADFVVENAEKLAEGATWKMSPSIPYYMDNFSHGTAGIAYFLIKAFEVTGEVVYRDLAIQASEYLYLKGNSDGMICHHDAGGEDLFYLSWCHGPPGTSRLYFLMYQLTEDQKWIDRIIRNADAMIEMELDINATPGFWNNEGWCCGSVGIAIFYRRVSLITGIDTYAYEADRMEDRILNAAIVDGNSLYWKHAENRRSPDQEFVQTGLMQGSAGFGLYFLRQYYRLTNKSAFVYLPDEERE